MIVEYLRYTIDPARQAAFIADYTAAAEPLMTSPHAVSFDMCQCAEEPSEFILRIEWTSAEDHLRGFRGSAPFKAFFAHIKPYLKDIQEMRHYERLVSA
ncbi:antibiotic biosynthesis monooxygenase family protein [uncultured Litoreibacter sp.]|uniref:putative quinol monooxygenase n=1 Tax=uncultured Litoreibacter sp. TaxID=1392394 RepID=UPI00261533DC|nr:antibiotic biosynthesis monooxygenase family protein [uncultured Litoreibacter sp.]